MSSISKSLLLTTSAIAGLAALQLASPAQAESFGIHNDQPDILEVTVAEDEEISGTDIGIYADNGAVVVDNAGTVRGEGTGSLEMGSRPSGGIVIAQAGSSITNSGEISGAANGIITSHFYSEDENDDELPPEARAANTVVVNSGAVSGEAGSGVSLVGGGSVTNSGTIRGANGQFGSGVNGVGVSISEFSDAIAEDAEGVGSIVNNNGGLITGETFGAILTGGGTVENHGTISAYGQYNPMVPGALVPTAVQLGATPEQEGRNATLTNDGTVQGMLGVVVGGALETVTIQNDGTISGSVMGIVGSQTNGTLTINNGEEGEILASGNAIVANTSTLTVNNSGLIQSQTQVGINISSANAVIDNSGTIRGGTNAITTAALQVSPNEYVNSAMNVAVTNSGTIEALNGTGVRLQGGGSVSNSGSIRGTVDGVYVAMLPQQDTEAFSASVTNSAAGTISGNRFGINLIAGGSVENAGEITGGTVGVVVQNSLELDDVEGSVSNSGTIESTGYYGVAFDGLANAVLTNGGTITSESGDGVNSSYMADGHTSVENQTGGTITGAASGIRIDDGTAAIVNAGTIRGDGSNTDDFFYPDAGITITGGAATVTNSGTITGQRFGITTAPYMDPYSGDYSGLAIGTNVGNSGTIIGDNDDGVRLIGGGIVTNSGRIEGQTSALADGISMFAYEGQDSADFSASVVNNQAGTIEGNRYGIILSGGGSIENAGRISGEAAGAVIESDAAQTPGLAAIFVNSGMIESSGGAAIVSDIQSSITNSGILAGGDGVAIQLGAADDVVTLKTGSAITGLVDAGGGEDSLILEGSSATQTSTQQLTAAAGFEELQVTAGYWSTLNSVGEFGAVTIGQGAALQVNEVPEANETTSPILTTTVVTNGLLVLNFSADDVLSELDELSISGTGNLQLIGEAVFTVDTDTIAHTGETIISNGGLILSGSLSSDVVTAGDGYFQLGTGGTEGSFSGDIVNDGRFVFDRSDDYDFLGAFSGTGTLDKLGDGTLTFMGDYAFEGITNIFSGAVRIGGTIDPETSFNLGDGGSLDITGKDQTIGGLSGEAGAQVALGSNQLTVDQDDNSEFAGSISGSGGFAKTGDGTLNLSGDSDYTGPTTVDGGKLAVNGSIVSDVTVNDGGALGGNGSVGSASINSGGALAPGNSIGHLTVNGGLSFAAGSLYEVEVNAAGQADRVDATGHVTIDGEAAVAVMAAEGRYSPRTDYVILTGGEGVEGTFGTVTTDLAFLDPLLRYTSDTVTLSLYRSDIDFADVAIGGNQASVAAAIQSRGIDDPLFEAVLVQNAAGAQTAFGDMSGEILASTVSGLNDDSRHLRNALLSLTSPEKTGMFAWGAAFGGWGDFGESAGRLAMDNDHSGVVTGIGYANNGFAAAVSVGLGNSQFRLDGHADEAEADSTYLAGQIAYGTGSGFHGMLGLSYAWHDIDTVREIEFAPLAQTLASSRNANTVQVFGEVAYDVMVGNVALTPFGRLAHVRTSSDAFAETGGNAALSLAKTDQEITFFSLGAKARLNANKPGFQPFASAAWNHASDGSEKPFAAAFATGGGNFALLGASVPEDSAEIEAGFGYTSGNLWIGVAYSGTLALDRTTHGLRITGRVAF
ncbi:hypothetical protein SZ64_10400 [Erythrobacter sp. SG61-1L]|uniref:autotransporter domain-containing protein n=1 Tax=Erythrobacter sp. SG61-1L TaxID=1603897 RepID=UPI0006C9225D|nr:autotransporter domain-containing protein [Erythrobacter sp. SG61-1L]KPL68482.1 hypothetical protein SZ64_10400 [Erythrobacter sp. SG61-1L]